MAKTASLESSLDSSLKAVLSQIPAAMADESKTAEAEKAFDTKMVGELEKGRQERQATPAPQVPHIEQYKPPPPTNIWQAFGSPAMMIASLGSLFTRRHATGALNAMSGVMKAYQEGDIRRGEQAFEQWKVNTDNMLKLHDYEMKGYDAAMKRINADESTIESEIRTLAAANNNTTLKRLLDAGQGLEGIGRYLNEQKRWGLEAARSRDEFEQSHRQSVMLHDLDAATKDRAAAQQSGDPARIQAADAKVAEAEQRLQNYRMVYGGAGSGGSALSAEKLQIFNDKVKEFKAKNSRDPTADERAQMLKDSMATGGGAQGMGGSMKGRFDENMVRAGGEINRTLKMIGQMDTDTTGGIFSGGDKGFRTYLEGRFQTQDQGMFDSAFGGVDVEMGNLLKNGLNVTEGTAEEMIRSFKPVPSDTMLGAMYKLANMKAKVKTAAENLFPANPDAKAKRDALLHQLDEWPDPEDVYRAAHSDEKVTGRTYGAVMREIKQKFGGQGESGAGGAPKAGDIEDGHRFKGGDPADAANWEKVEPGGA